MMRAALLSLMCLAGAVTQAPAQQPPLRVVVEYITTSQVYLSAGQLQGLFANDTVTARRGTGARDSLRLAIASSSRTRSVATPDANTAVNRGDVLFIEVSAAALQRAAALRAPPPVVTETATPPPAAAVVAQRQQTRPGINGRIGVELDAMQTEVRYGAGEDQSERRTWFTPTLRLRLRTEALPGGLRLSTNLRATQLSSTSTNPAELRVQLYQASLEGDIKPAGLHFQFGRFYNSYESHSGYWDGMLLRVGSNGVGAGIVAGYTPEHGNQTLSSASPKVSAFVDAHVRRGSFRYDVDLSAHQQSNIFLVPNRQFVGLSQSIAFGRSYFTQRVQLGKTGDQLELWQAQITANTVVAGPLSVNARFTTERNDLYFGNAPELGRRTRVSAGAVLSGKAGFANAEAGRIDNGFGSEATTASLNFFLPRSLGIAGLGFSGNLSRDSAYTSTYVAPYIERASGGMRARLGATYYRTDFGANVFEQKGGDISLTLPLGRRTEISWTAAASTGSSMRTARTSLALWRSF